VDCQTPFKRGEGWQSECAVREANARLIAAAPDLLDAIKPLLALLEPVETLGLLAAPELEKLNAARAAIAKAEGGAA
jgi:hypothetical protein